MTNIMPEESKSRVEKLSEILYSRSRYKDPLDARSGVKSAETPEVSENWQGPALDDILARDRKEREITPFMKKFFIFSILFFIATLVVAGFVFLGGVNFISSKNVNIAVVGPANVPSGEILELEVTIENSNNADLELANFSVHYPQGARDPADFSKPLTFTKDELGEIGAGDEAVRNIRVYLVGAAGETRELKFTVEYKVKGSNATFYKDKIYTITLGDSPLALEIKSPSSVASGERFKTRVAVTLESPEAMRGVMIRAEYPYGFSAIKTSPEALSENNVWALGDLMPGAKREIEIEGALLGEDGDERTFRFYVGVSDNGSANPNFKTVIVSNQETVMVERPAIGLSVSFNGESGPTYVAPAERLINATVSFQNNLPERLVNPRLEIKMSGGALNESSITAYNSGFYNSSTDRLSWSLFSSGEQNELLPGESDLVTFSFASLPDLGPSGGREIVLDLTLTGSLFGSRETVSVSERRTVKIASQISLNSKTQYSIGPFKNSGPIPPVAEQETTYTILWSVGNTQNDLSDAKVTARLGPAVKWLGAHSEKSEDIKYDEASNMVTWNIGNLASGTGFSSPFREAAFQVSITPSKSQIGLAPVLVSNISFMGLENLSNRNISVSSNSLTTKLSGDPEFIQGDDVVRK